MGKKKAAPTSSATVNKLAEAKYNSLQNGPAANAGFADTTKSYQILSDNAATQNVNDYGNMMGGYNAWNKNMSDFQGGVDAHNPHQFSYDKVGVTRPEELGEAYGYLREAAPGYRDFANTGGYSGADVQELRARGIEPIRSSYGNTMMELNRARSLGGAGGSPNYIAAVSRANREMPGQMADAMTGVNAQLAQDIRQGKLAGLAGLSGIGSEMGGLSSAESGRQLQADLANQGADIQTQQLTESAYGDQVGRQMNARQLGLSGLAGQNNLYGTSPGMASTFGNQALQAWQQQNAMQGQRSQEEMGYLDMMLKSQGVDQQADKGTPWWKTALSVAGTVAPYVAMAASSQGLKTDIQPTKNYGGMSGTMPALMSNPVSLRTTAVSSRKEKYDIERMDGDGVGDKLKKLPLYTWKYKSDKQKTTHFGPIAEEFSKKFGIGDGKTLHLADVMGVVLASQKEALNNAK